MPNKNHVLTKVKLESEQLSSYKYYSISRLDTYKTCPRLYYNKYVLKIPVISESKSTVIGSIVHNVLERYYCPSNITISNKKIEVNKNIKELYDEVLEQTLIDKKLLPERGLKSYEGKLLTEYLEGYKLLSYKASAQYTGKDAIRKGDRTVAQKPEMTSGWKKMAEALGLDSKKGLLDSITYQTSTLNISLPEVCFATEKMLGSYKDPILPLLAKGYKVRYLELPLSDIHRDEETNDIYLVNGVLLPEGLGKEEGIYLRGYIDIILEDPKGNLIVIDHKTSASAFSASHVQYNAQTITYAWCLKQILDTPIVGIGINNIREGTLNIVELDDDAHITDVIENTFQTHKLIKTEIYPKHMPSSNYSKCLDSYGEVCPYLDVCWNNHSFYKK